MQKLAERDSKPFYQHRFVNKNRRKLIDFNFRGLPETYGHPAIGTYFHQPNLERFLKFSNHKQPVDAFYGHEVIAIDNIDAISARVQVKKAGSDDVFALKGVIWSAWMGQ